MKRLSLIILLAVFIMFSESRSVAAQSGKDGAETITTAGVIFNRYTTLASSASAGSISISVSNAASLAAGAIAGATNNPYATAALGYGDLVMIIKMQGATINTTNTLAYGTVASLNNTGVYEIKVVRGVTSNLITFCSGLSYSYTVGGTERVQVIRIPRLSALTINAAASLTAPAWGSSYTGGVVAVEVSGNTIVNGSITVAGLGYRGGAVDNNSSGAPGGSTNYISTASTDGGEKGESIVGYQADYDAAGRYDRGAPANGGGGGNSHNAGGGGGANGNNGNTWTGQGVMVTSASNPLAAWALDPGYIANGNALTSSSGGGRGGYSYGSANQDATTTAPGNTAWGGDYRREAGGLGGRPLTYATNTLYMGGGGGAGDANNTAAQNGANGGGIIYLLGTGTLSGSGSINANGANALPTISGHNDAPGGGGGGGAIRLNIQGAISGVTISANGGTGGNQLITAAESEGPGGGGGGGYIRTTGTPTVTVTGGANGTTTSTAVTEFTNNGATAGASGQVQNAQTFEAAPTLSCFPLPVTLVSFEAKINSEKEGILTWSGTEENNMLFYIVEYSTDGTQWQTLSQVAARNQPGIQQYAVNTGRVSGTRFYRLRIVNMDQSYQYSETRLLTGEFRPRVSINGGIVLLTGVAPDATAVRIYNSSGAQVAIRNLAGETSFPVGTEKLAAGVYYLRVLYRSGQEEVIRFINR